MNTFPDLRKPWQRTRWVQALAILLGYIPPLAVFITQLFGGPVTAQGYMIYAMGYTFFVIAVLLLLLWVLCGEKTNSLNRRPGKWWKDLLGGIVLVMLTFSVKILFDPVIAKFFYRASDVESGMGSLVNKLADNPWLAALFLEPALFIGVAGSEKAHRRIFYHCWMKISSSKVWLSLGVFLSAFLFGLNHVAQGTAGSNFCDAQRINHGVVVPAFWAHLSPGHCSLPVRCHSTCPSDHPHDGWRWRM